MEISEAVEKVQGLSNRTMLESDMVVPRKKKTSLLGIETKINQVEFTNQVEPNCVTEGILLHDLMDSKKQRLRDISMSSANIEKCKIDQKGIYHLNCINCDLDGRRHQITGVRYERRRISVNSVEIE